MGTKDILIGIPKRFANLKLTKKMAKFIKENKGKWSGKIHILDVKYSQEETNNFYKFKIETELPLDNAAEYLRVIVEKVVKGMSAIPFIKDKATNESNIMRFIQFKSKYINKIDS